MADYYVILKRAVEALPDGNRERRQAIYDKARKALLTKLQNMDPPLAPSDISRQRMALEEAVRAVERDLTLQQQEIEADEEAEDFASPPSYRPQAAEGEAQGADDEDGSDDYEPSRAPEVSVSGDTYAEDEHEESEQDGDWQTAKPDAPAVVTVASTKGSAAVPVADPSRRLPNVDLPSNDDDRNAPDAGANFSASDRVVRRAGQDVLKNAVRDANALGAATNAAVKSAQDAADAVGEQRSNEATRIEPTLGEVVVSKSRTYQRTEPTMEPVAKSSQPKPVQAEVDKPAKKEKADPLDVPEPEEGEGSRSRYGMIVGILLGAGVLGGSGYLLYQNMDALLAPDSQGEDGDAAQNAESDGGQEMQARQVRTVTVQPPAEDAASGDTASSGGSDAATPEAPQDGAQDAAPADNAGQDAPADEARSATEPDTATAPAQQQAATGVAVAQQSILYEEEGTAGEPGSATAGEVVWTLDGSGDKAAIVARADIPGKGISFEIRISKNGDAELPASHLIEISAVRQDMDPDRAIASIPGLILKPTEQSRGEGLVGAAIRIADDLHWIALTAGPREQRYNLELLSLRSWIDIPIQYNSGRRAILTLEKGPSGDRVIENAIDEWGETLE